MKKIGVLFLTIALLSTCLIPTLSVSALDKYIQDADNAPAYSIDLTGSDCTTKVKTQGVTKFSYDENEQALKVYSEAQGNAPARVMLTYPTDNKIKTADAPVIAVVVKANAAFDPEFATRTSVTSTLKNAGAKYETTNTKVATYGVTNATNAPKTVDLGNGYMLLFADLWEADYLYATNTDNTKSPMVGGSITLTETIVDLLPYGYKTADIANDYFFVKYVGVFATVADAKTYYGVNVDNYQVLRFDTEENADASSAYVTNSTASSIGYDEENKALCITPNTSASDSAKISIKNVNLDPGEYSYVSIKLKLADASSKFGQIAGRTVASDRYKKFVGNNNASTYSITNTAAYEATTDWQILNVNIADKTGTVAPLNGYPITSHTSWNEILVQFCPYNETDTATEKYYVEYIGFFRSAEDAEEYDRIVSTVDYEGVQTRDADSENKYDLRFIASIEKNEIEKYDAVGMIISASCKDGIYDLSEEVTSVYEFINATDNDKMVKFSVDGKYLMAITVGNIPTSAGEVTYSVTPYAVKDGIKYTGEAYTVIFDGVTGKPVTSLR